MNNLPRFREPRWLAVFAVLAAFGLIARTEIAAIIAEVPVRGQGFTPAALDSLLHPNSAGTAFAAWATVPCPPTGVDLAGWLRLYYLADIVFVLGYAVLLSRPRRLRASYGRPISLLLVLATLGSDAGCLSATDRLQHRVGTSVICTASPLGSDALLFRVIAGLTVLKWLALVLLLLIAGYRYYLSDSGRALAANRRIGWHALSAQKYLLLVVLALGVLLLLHGSAMLDQGVDVERSWFLTDQHGRGLQSAALAVLAFVLLCLGLRYLASVLVGGIGRTDPYLSGRDLASILRWVSVAGLFALASWLVQQLRWAVLDWRAVWVVVAVLLAVPLLSLLSSWVPAPELSAPDDDAVRRLAWRIGRLLAWLPLVVLLLSVSRAFVPPLILGYSIQAGMTALVLVPAVLAALVLYLVLSFDRQPRLVGLSASAWHPQRVGNPFKRGVRRTEVAIALAVPIAAVVAGAVVMLLVQRQTADVVGVIGIFALSFSTLSAGYALLLVAGNQATRTPYLFRLLRMRRTPVVGLSILVIVVSTFVAKGSTLHDIRQRVAGYSETAPTADPASAFEAWNAAWDAVDSADPDGTLANSITDGGVPTKADGSPAPAVATGNGTAAGNQTQCSSIVVKAGPIAARVRPMLFVAAEGGGIRAEVWTVDAMSRLMSSYQGCGKQAVFVTSGVSGGATGLGLLDTARAPMQALASSIGEVPLANAVSGLLVHDLFAGVLGWDLRSIDAQPGEPGGSSGGPTGAVPDRAALLEQAWERDLAGKDAKAGTGFGRSFPITETGAAPTWRTVFNSTSVGLHCRALVTDLALGAHAGSCTDPDNPVPGSYDLLGSQPCYRGLPTSTAALLAARFPYVTPSGVIRNCGTGSQPGSGFADQLIDGGYSENTGIDTLDSLLTNLMPLIQATNYQSLVEHADGLALQDAPSDLLPVIVVPMLVFLHNTTAGTLPTESKATPQAEVLVPPLNMSAGGVLGANDTLLQRAAALTDQLYPGGSPSQIPMPSDQNPYAAQEDALANLISGTFPSRVMTVAPQYAPQVALPLGWSISKATVDTMGKALDSYLRCQPPSGLKLSAATPDPVQRATAQVLSCTQMAAFDRLAELLGVPRCFSGAGSNGDLKPCTGPPSAK